MGGRASTPLKQFPKPNPSTFTPRPSNTPLNVPPHESTPHHQVVDQHASSQMHVEVETTEEEIKQQQQQEQQMREYLESLQQLSGSIHEYQASHAERITPEGVCGITSPAYNKFCQGY